MSGPTIGRLTFGYGPIRLQDLALTPEQRRLVDDRAKQLREALRTYGRHLDSCRRDEDTDEGTCSCGFSAALRR